MANLTVEQKAELVRGLCDLAKDSRESPWAGRLYLAAATWIARSVSVMGLSQAITIAQDHVKNQPHGEKPDDFRSFVESWLSPGQTN